MKYYVVISIFLLYWNTIHCVDKNINKKKGNVFTTTLGSFQVILGAIMAVYSFDEIAKSVKEKLPLATILDKNCYDFLGAFFGVNIAHVGWQRITQKNYTSAFFKGQRLLCDQITFYHAKCFSFCAFNYIKNSIMKRKKPIPI